ncbi:MAG: thioredoxin domain-containing protein [Spirochaetales bacterium]
MSDTSDSRSLFFDPRRNALDRASSPYLRQHADNPVHWQQWSAQAFEYAREHDLVVFVSVGYSTCHWCHVMADGAFSNPEVADRLNRDFVSIKVDREERPDIDQYLMSFLVETTGQGGWPLNAFLSPNQETFFAMTYSPAPDDPRAASMMSFDQVLDRVRAFYDEKKDKLGVYEPKGRGGAAGAGGGAAAGAPGEIRMDERISLDDIKPGNNDIDRLTTELSRVVDTEWAGFGPGPKFPPHSTLLWMLYAHAASGDTRLADMSRAILDRMASRGLHDHLQGGFFRYCVDREWTIPHFEKMLYDQALLLWSYAAAAYHFNSSEYERVAQGVVRCLEETFREDTHGLRGALYVSAHDADTDHKEGATYLWSEDEIRSLLSDTQWNAFRETFELPPGGNFEGRVHLVSKVDVFPQSHAPLDEALETLRAARAERRQPFTDTKVVTSWNALAATALVIAGRLLARPEWSARGNEIAEELTSRHDSGERIAHASLDGHAGSSEFLGDYGALMLLHTVRAEEDRSRLEAVSDLERRLSRFRTSEGGWIESAQADFRSVPPDTFDQPIPSSPALVDLARARYAMIAHVPWEQTEPGRATINDFANLASLARAGLFHIIESPDAPRWREVPLNSVWTGGEALRHCYAGACRPGLPGEVDSR